MPRNYYVYILANRSRTLYVKVALVEAQNPEWADLGSSLG
jgi:hypothetical protein